jgi:hypothetical protein
MWIEGSSIMITRPNTSPAHPRRLLTGTQDEHDGGIDREDVGV